MSRTTLQDCRILVVEDEYILAADIHDELSEAGAIVLGPFATIRKAARLVASNARIDGAVLDVNLGGEWVFPVADLLVQRGVPFVFSTGYGAAFLPPRFRHIVRCEKPVSPHTIAQAIERAVHPV